MASIDDVVTNEQILDIANGIRALTRTTTGMTILEMPERLRHVRVIEHFKVTVPVTQNITPIFEYDDTLKHLFLVLPQDDETARELKRLHTDMGLVAQNGILYITHERTSTAELSLYVVDMLLAEDAETSGFLILQLLDASVLEYKGSVRTYQDLPENADVGDIWNVEEAYLDYNAGTNFAWDGARWDGLGGTYDYSTLATKQELSNAQTLLNNAINLKADKTELTSAVTSLTTEINKKADQSFVENEVATIESKKADKTELASEVSTIQGKLDLKASKLELTSTEQSLEGKINLKANSVDVYLKTETYDQETIDTKIDNKAEVDNTYTKAEVDSKESSLQSQITGLTSTKADKTELTSGLAAKISITDIENSLTSTSTVKPLSANMGKVLKDRIDGKEIGKGFPSIQAMVNYLNGLNEIDHKRLSVSFNLLIGTLEVPDFWVYSVESSFNFYTYTTDQALINAVDSGFLQIGFYKISKLETTKVDLTNYALIENVYSKQGIDELWLVDGIYPVVGPNGVSLKYSRWDGIQYPDPEERPHAFTPFLVEPIPNGFIDSLFEGE